MKILWFANTPCGASEKLTGNAITSGGWLYALSSELAKIAIVDLHIAFYWGNEIDPFEYNGITYHPVLRNGDGGKIGRMINRFKKAHGNSLTLKELPRLREVVLNVRPDLIHFHGSEENFGILAKENLDCPVVLSIQGLLSPCLSKLYSGFQKTDINKAEGLLLKLICSGIDMSEKSFVIRATLEREMFTYIPNIIGRTFWDKACSLALNPKRKYYEVNEILRPEFFESRWEKNSFNKSFTLVSIISNGWYKGVETIFNTANVLDCAGFNFQWNVIGSNSKDTAVRLAEKLINKKASDLHINLLGRKNASQMVEIMTMSDTYVQVSHIENSPNSLCEAMLLGMPCIATFAGGTSSILENYVEGRLVQDGDPYVMAGIIMEMADNFDSAKEYGEKANKRAAVRHKPENVVSELINTYQNIIS